MTSWTKLPRATFDLETTGIDPKTARIVTASLVLVSPDGEVLRAGEWLADPGVEIPEQASAIHGITTEYAREHGKPAQQVAYEVAMALGGLFADGVPVIAFNAAYDFSVLHFELARYGYPPLTCYPVLDPLVINKHVHKFKKGKRTLEVLANEYSVELENAHTSKDDALAAERLLTAMSFEYEEIEQPATALHEQQITWAAEQAAELQDYFNRIGKQADVSGAWPVRTD
ncbi:3'-5' exonuclease [Rothia nasimurium]|uniref:3'-5' exonuclease n=1 Tax=Rothia nasimurium TaxID=85336 RepID=A0A4Y9F6G1_9MICC|nr:3'-5' exonuclease [Rothia nasimurium]MBF0807700.1 3'-5' exonuclease [Rothia nasimurium]TFU23221.1 3'-5' exonuclease [Rothia nasimurium]